MILKQIIATGSKVPKWNGPLNYIRVGYKNIIPAAHNPTNWKLNLTNENIPTGKPINDTNLENIPMAGIA